MFVKAFFLYKNTTLIVNGCYLTPHGHFFSATVYHAETICISIKW